MPTVWKGIRNKKSGISLGNEHNLVIFYRTRRGYSTETWVCRVCDACTFRLLQGSKHSLPTYSFWWLW